MTAAQFRRWRDRLGMTQAAASEALGLSLRQIKRLEAGDDISRVIELACRAVEADAQGR